MDKKEMLDKKHKAIYTVGDKIYETEISAKEIVQYGLKRAIRYHAALLGLTLIKYHCHVEGMEKKESVITTNELKRKKDHGQK